MNENWAREIAKALCNGLSFMHSKKIAHRDIKLHNIMVDNEGKPIIIDFGLSALAHPNIGTEKWYAPE